MDSGWAALIGAVVGAVVSTCIPWLREAVTEKRRSRQKRHDDMTAALTDVVAAMALAADHVIKDPSERVVVETALARFTLLTTPDEKPVVHTLIEATYDMTSDTRSTRLHAYAVYTDLVSRWHQGVLTPTDVRTQYHQYMPQDRPARNDRASGDL